MNEKLKEKTKDIIRLSIPYTGANLLQAVSEQVTIVLLGKTSSNTLAAYGLFTLLDPINLLFNAPLTALPAIIGTLHGENDRPSIATILQQGWVAGLILCIPQAILLCYAKPLLKLLGQPNHLIKLAESSFYFSIINLPTASLLLTSTSYAYGANKTLAIFSLSILNLLSNLSLTILFVLRPLQLSLKGYIFSTIGQSLLANIAFTAYLKHISSREGYPLFTFRIHNYKSLAKRFLKLGSSTAAKTLIIVISMVYKQTLIGLNGEKAMLATQAINVYTGYPTYINDSISMAICTLIGQSIGKKDLESISYYYKIALVCALGTSLTFALPCFIIPRRIIQLSLKIEKDEDFSFLENLLYINAIQLIIDSISQILTGTFFGTEDSTRPALISLLTFLTIILPLSLSFHFYTDLGVLGIEWGYLAGSLVQAGAMAILWNKKNNGLTLETENLNLASQENEVANNFDGIIEETFVVETATKKKEKNTNPLLVTESTSLLSMENNTSPINSCNFERASTSLKQFGIFKLDQLHTPSSIIPNTVKEIKSQI